MPSLPFCSTYDVCQPPTCDGGQDEVLTCSPPPEVHRRRETIGSAGFFSASCARACAHRFIVLEVVGRGSYGTVCAAMDNLTGERVAIKRIEQVFEHPKDATRILREIKLLALLKHPDIVGIKHILLPSNPRSFHDLFVVCELMESDLHTVIGANDDLTADHHRVFLYQLLRGLDFVHSSGVVHRDLKPKNILANGNCKLKICDFGLARPFLGEESATAWTDYVATRWYRAPELLGCFYGVYGQAVDIWSAGCIFAETLLGKPLFPGRDTVHQLQLITGLLGKPPTSFIDRISNQRARGFLHCLPEQPAQPFEEIFGNVDRLALDLLRQLLSFDPAQRPSAAEALQHPYFHGLPRVATAGCVDIGSQFDFDSRLLTTSDVRDLIYKEVLNYHPHAKARHFAGSCQAFASQYDNDGADGLKRQFLEAELIGGAVPGSRFNANSAKHHKAVAEPPLQQAPELCRARQPAPAVMQDQRAAEAAIKNAAGAAAKYEGCKIASGGCGWGPLYGAHASNATCAEAAAAATQKFAPAAMLSVAWRNEHHACPDALGADW